MAETVGAGGGHTAGGSTSSLYERVMLEAAEIVKGCAQPSPIVEFRVARKPRRALPHCGWMAPHALETDSSGFRREAGGSSFLHEIAGTCSPKLEDRRPSDSCARQAARTPSRKLCMPEMTPPAQPPPKEQRVQKAITKQSRKRTLVRARGFLRLPLRCLPFVSRKTRANRTFHVRRESGCDSTHVTM
mmetsp:Transcript_166249/g.533842  ORF Transcript_166249/g.533842 Transcript_166249/m.533842 type:complete len:188 (-) Transcript_166249:10-573(-)